MRQTPEAVAISDGADSWTYRELDVASNQLAHLMTGYGARPGSSVALLFHRSAEAIVAILAVLKTGAAYLPIDPALPAARMQFMLADAAPVAAITTAALRSRLDGHDLAVLVTSEVATDVAAAALPSTPLPAPTPDDIAYLIYTSGTTGARKVLPSATTTSPSCCHRLMRGCLARVFGRSVIPWPSTFRCGRSSAPSCVAAGW